MNLELLKYPIGKCQLPSVITDDDISMWIREIESLPNKLSHLVSPLNNEQLNTPYRPEGWTVRQVINHLPDSHTNSYIRFKWALTENNPTIKTYNEQAWANLTDYTSTPIETALVFLTGLHAKWVQLLSHLTPEQLDRTFVNPESNQQFTLKATIGMYAWHGEHHYQHINKLIERKGW